jgi:hypothetical protein
MEVKNWWTAVEDWDSMTGKQKKSIIVWLENYLGKDFAKQLDIADNNKRLSLYKNPEDHIDVSEMSELIEILACYDPIRIRTHYVTKVDAQRKLYIGVDGAKYPTKEKRDEADMKMKEIILELTDEKGWKKLRAKKDEEEKNQSGAEYHINLVRENGEVMLSILDSLEDAIEEAKNLTGSYLMGTVRMSLDEVCDEDKLDWTKENVIEIPKAKLIESRLNDEFSILYKTVKDSPLAEKILKTTQNNEFIDFLRTV